MEAYLNAVLQSIKNKSKTNSDSNKSLESAAVTKKHEEFLKHDALIEVCCYYGQKITKNIKTKHKTNKLLTVS